MKRPLLIVAVGYIIGIVWGLYCNCSIAFLYVIIIPIYFFIMKNKKTKKEFRMFAFKRYFRYIKLFLKPIVIMHIVLASLISNSIVMYQNKKYDSLYYNIKEINITGIIVSNPQEKEYKNIYKLKVELLNGQNKYKNSYLLLNTNNKNLQIEYGDKVLVKGEFVNPSGQRNYKGFNYKEYLKTQKVYGSINAKEIKVLDKKCINCVFMLSNKILKCIKSNIEKSLPEKYSSLLIAIMLGDKGKLSEDIIQDFRDSNIAHILAVSGIHITYIIFGVTKTFDLLLGKRKSKVITIIVLIVYMFITGFSLSVVRATIMGILLMLSKTIYRKNDIWNSISLSILCILINNPLSILNIGMLLSYGGTIGIIMFNNTICSMLSNIKIKNIKYKYKIYKFEKHIKYIKDSLAVSISVYITILPIIVCNFNIIGIAFLITNVLLSIVIAPLIIFGFLFIITSIFAIKELAGLAYLLIAILQSIIIISKLGSVLPFNKMYVGTPDFFQIIIYYFLVFLINFIYKVYMSKVPTSFEYRIKNIISLAKYKARLNKKKIVSSVLAICVLSLIIENIPQKLQIHFIDVGQGDSCLIRTPMRKTILIDGGGSEISSTFDVGKSTLIPYLLDRKITKIDYIIITHMDQDHYQGCAKVMEELKVKTVIISKQGETCENYEEFKRIVKDKKIKVLVIGKGERLKIENNMYVDFLWPNNSELVNENILNNNSIVCKLHYKSFSALFTGDIENVAENQILEDYKGKLQILNSTILKVAHHGSKTSSTQEFLDAVKPKIALIGVGKNNNFGHPNNEVLERLKNMRNKNIPHRPNGRDIIDCG